MLHFLQDNQDDDGSVRLSAELMNAFDRDEWPGNVRELKNAVEYATNMTDEPVIQIWHIPEKIHLGTASSPPDPISRLQLMRIEEMEELLLKLGVETCGTSEKAKREIVSRLGISQASVYRKMSKYGICGKG